MYANGMILFILTSVVHHYADVNLTTLISEQDYRQLSSNVNPKFKTMK